MAIHREGHWDKKAWRDAENTREAAVGWLLAAAGGRLAANENELAKKLVEDGFDTWAAMDLTEEELTEIGFSRGGARSFATECRAMRAARGIFDRPPEAITVASKGQQRTVTVTFPSTDTTRVRPIPENPLARGTLATLSDFQCHYRNDYSAAKADKAKPATDDKQAAAAKAALQADAKDAEEKKALRRRS